MMSQLLIKKVSRMDETIQLSFILTTQCNLKCDYCFYENGTLSRNWQNLEVEEIIDFIDRVLQYKTVSVVSLSGGEVLLYRKLPKLLKEIKKRVSYIQLMTNGTIINSYHFSPIVEDLLDEIHVSLDSITSDYHEKHRGKHQRTIKGIQTIASSKVKNLTICTTLSPDNLDQIQPLIEFSQTQGCQIDFHLLEYSADDSKWEEHKSEYLKKIQNKLKYWSQNGMIPYMRYAILLKSLKEKEWKPKVCQHFSNGVVIDCDGTVYPCFHNKVKLGSIHKNTVEEIMDSKSKLAKKYHNHLMQCYSLKCSALIA
jgi:sulfatase maturation enzyme AslB (radical SAM superfamily)